MRQGLLCRSTKAWHERCQLLIGASSSSREHSPLSGTATNATLGRTRGLCSRGKLASDLLREGGRCLGQHQLQQAVLDLLQQGRHAQAPLAAHSTSQVTPPALGLESTLGFGPQ